MLTILHPQLYQQILSYPIGIMAAPDPEGGNPFLIVKATKEFLLAAKISGFIKVYVCPAELGGRDTLALVFAFYDDEDEPLIIRTPLVDDVESRHLLATLTSPLVNVHFFDEHGREFLVYEAELDLPKVTRARLDGLMLLESDFIQAQNMLHGVAHWFGLRTSQDDEEALTVRLVHNPFGESLAIQDSRYPLHQHHGGKGYSISMLERESRATSKRKTSSSAWLCAFPKVRSIIAPSERLTERKFVTSWSSQTIDCSSSKLRTVRTSSASQSRSSVASRRTR
ncbi:hypothetical protein ACDI97_10625 [Xanthomonas axonopodis pv. fascicularis]|uniref:hypothetical protein n=1 Tax=Xanthomonas axonopodis TaxID=53413 RepID=UPI0035308F9B